jgi:hypothetical protein
MSHDQDTKVYKELRGPACLGDFVVSISRLIKEANDKTLDNHHHRPTQGILTGQHRDSYQTPGENPGQLFGGKDGTKNKQ